MSVVETSAEASVMDVQRQIKAMRGREARLTCDAKFVAGLLSMRLNRKNSKKEIPLSQVLVAIVTRGRDMSIRPAGKSESRT